MAGGRIIDGAVFDAKAEAEDIRAAARADAQQIRDDARREAASIVAHAHDRGAPAAPIGIEAIGGPGRVTEITGLVIRAEIEGVFLGEVVEVDRAGAGPVTAEVVG